MRTLAAVAFVVWLASCAFLVEPMDTGGDVWRERIARGW